MRLCGTVDGLMAEIELAPLSHRLDDEEMKTLAKRLGAAVQAGDKDRIAAEHRELVRWLDRAAARGALHRNTAARRKAQAARLVSSGK